jgi:voltage-gated potassium channel Kch
MKTNITLKHRLQYHIEDMFSRGTPALVIALGLFSVIIVFLTAAVLNIAGLNPQGQPANFGEAVWYGLIRTMSPGPSGNDSGWAYRLLMLAVPTLGGIFITSSLIGVLTTGLEGKFMELRKGRSRVLESGHTVVLGWSEMIFTVLAELILANRNQKRACIVVLGEKDKIEMEDAIRERLGNLRTTRIVCRTGSPIEINDLRIVSPETARSIIILSPEAGEPDAEVIKTVLAVTKTGTGANVVAQVRSVCNIPAARLASKTRVEWVAVGDVVARIIAQTSRQSGLSVVYTELLDFSGDEIYEWEAPDMDGKTFGEVLQCFEGNAVIGLHPQGSEPHLNPPMNTRIQPGDRLIVLAADDTPVDCALPAHDPVEHASLRSDTPAVGRLETLLMLGWNWRGRTILRELERYVTPGSELVIVSPDPLVQTELDDLSEDLLNLQVSFKCADTTHRDSLEALGLGEYEHVILLSYSDRYQAQQADARTLITLLHLRDLADRNGYTYSIVSEMLDLRNRDLAEVAQADDFIVSDRLISLLLAQISENRHLNAIFADLFSPAGSEIYLKPACNYIVPGQPVNFYTIVEAARRCGQAAIGYRRQVDAQNAARNYGVVLNPRKSEKVTFTDKDRIIVLAEH